MSALLNNQGQSNPNQHSFLWGVSTSGYQSEGGFNGPDDPKNNWYRAEHHGYVMPTGTAAEFWTRYTEDFQRCQQIGVNGFRLGLEWARIQPSTSSKVTTMPDFDFEVLAAYGDRIAACRQHGLEPLVTLHHFTHPAWLGIDAWLSETTVDYFIDYVQTTVRYINRRLTDHYQLPPIRWYITVNEPNILIPNTYLNGMFPTDSRGVGAAVKAYSHLLGAHIRAYNVIHDLYVAEGWETPQVSLNTYCSDLYWSEQLVWDLLSVRQREVKFSQWKDYTAAGEQQLKTALQAANIPFQRDLPYRAGQLFQRFSHWLGRRSFTVQNLEYCLSELEASPRSQVFDFIPIDYYDPFIAHTFRIPSFSDFEFEIKDFRGWIMSGITSKWWDWRCLPEGLHFFCQYYARVFGDVVGRSHCPVMIAENGMALRRKPDNSVASHRRDQIRRSTFLQAHVQQVQRLLQEQIPLLGYFHWSLTDNYEWGSYTPRFGLFSIDFSQGSDRLVEDHLGDRPSETYAQLIRDTQVLLKRSHG